MKIIVTHLSPDLDAIGSVWVIKRFLPGWKDARVEFVPAGNRLERVKNHPDFENKPILEVGTDEIMHVDTGLGPLDHHQTSDMDTSGAKRSWEYVLTQTSNAGLVIKEEHCAAITRMMDVIVSGDHFQEVYRADAAADFHDFSLYGLNEGVQYIKPGEHDYFVEFGRTCLDYLFAYFENKIWAEKEMENGVSFDTKYGKAFAVESMNDTVGKLAQKKGYVLVVRKDPRRGNVSIKTMPIMADSKGQIANGKGLIANGLEQEKAGMQSGVDLTLAHEQMKKMDPDATWFLHVSKKMLLNGSAKNPNMKPTKLSLTEIVNVLKSLY